MPRLLPVKDFRARRRVLSRRDFAFAPNPPPRPTDRITSQTWDGLMVGPDDVAVRTSNYHGTALRQLYALWGAWVESLGYRTGPVFSLMLDAGDEFQAATYTAMTGYYRLSASALRSALELTATGVWARVCRNAAARSWWQGRKREISFGRSCDGLINGASEIERCLRSQTGDALFEQRRGSDDGGYLRRMFDGISNFTHARPGHSDSAFRGGSNGPIYVRAAFEHVAWMQFETFGACFALSLVANPNRRLPRAAVELFDDPLRLKSRVTRAAFELLHARG